MHPDLDRLVRLQQIDTFSEQARRRIADLPERLRLLDTRLASAREAVDAARERLNANQAARRAAERDLATHQARLAKFRDQLMEVKTNREYQAMQKEIETARAEVQALEDRVLERLIEADELTAEVKRLEGVLDAEQASVDRERHAMEAEVASLKAELEQAAERRRVLALELPPALLATFEQVARARRGVAVAEARDGHCTLCHVRLRPQVFNEIRRNEAIVQCESCQRILYFPSTGDAGCGAGNTHG